jgi:hypothetical protein
MVNFSSFYIISSKLRVVWVFNHAINFSQWFSWSRVVCLHLRIIAKVAYRQLFSLWWNYQQVNFTVGWFEP